jgi:hypothetical protein
VTDNVYISQVAAPAPLDTDTLQWLRNGLDPTRMQALAVAEIREARTATSRPRHWQPVEVEEAQLR